MRNLLLEARAYSHLRTSRCRISVPPLCPLCLCGAKIPITHTTEAQRTQRGHRAGAAYGPMYLSHNAYAILVIGLSLAFFLLPHSSAVAQKVVDKMVATVNAGVRTELITYSDLLWQLALQPETPIDNPTSADLNKALKILIDQRLILQEAEKLPAIAPTQKEVSDARDELARYFATPAEFQERMRKVGLTSEKLDEILEQRLKMEKYLSFRFQNFVVISQAEITDYYNAVFIPRFRARFPGRIVPKLEEARAEIETTLTEAKIESDTDAFLDTARERAEIVILNPV